MNQQLIDILDKAIFHEGEGPDGSQGQFYILDRDEYGNNIRLDVALNKYISEKEKAYFKSCLGSWAKDHPEMTVKELYDGIFNQKPDYRAAGITVNGEKA